MDEESTSKLEELPCNSVLASHCDLVGEPFAVLESDPGVFTALIRRLGFRGVEVEEVYDIQPWALDHLQPKGLILCFTWQEDRYQFNDFRDPDAESVWFANQLSDDACACQAILNVLFNVPGIEMEHELKLFKEETDSFSSVMKGLAFTNLPLFRNVQNSLARPSDIRGSLNTIAQKTHNAQAAIKRQKNTSNSKAKPAVGRPPKALLVNKSKPSDEDLPSYHFIGYVPAHGKVWELDSLKSGPLEVGELESSNPDNSQGWEDIVRPALRLKMQKYGAGNGDGGSIQFNLLAVVKDRYQEKYDQLELLKRKKAKLEDKLKEAFGDSWHEKVDPTLSQSATAAFSTLLHTSAPGRLFTSGYALEAQNNTMQILQLRPEELGSAWEDCMRSGLSAKVAVDEEIQKAMQAQMEHVKRTFDYEPFIREYITCLHQEGLLLDLLPKQKKPRQNSTTVTLPVAAKKKKTK